jgi:hypothetical protein
MNHKSFLMRRLSSRKNCLFKWNQYVCHKIVAVHFDIIWESIDNIEAARVLYDWKHEVLLWISSLRFVTTSSLDRVHMRRDDVFKENHDSSSITKWCQLSRSAAYNNDNIAFAYSFRFSRELCFNRCGTQCKWNNLKPIELCKCSDTVEWIIFSVSNIERADLKEIYLI